MTESPLFMSYYVRHELSRCEFCPEEENLGAGMTESSRFLSYFWQLSVQFDRKTALHEVFCGRCGHRGKKCATQGEAITAWNEEMERKREQERQKYNPDLAPCPFCGNKSDFLVGDRWVTCKSCRATGTFSVVVQENGLRPWNDRVRPDLMTCLSMAVSCMADLKKSSHFVDLTPENAKFPIGFPEGKMYRIYIEELYFTPEDE